jgi:argininosuccinate lyase
MTDDETSDKGSRLWGGRFSGGMADELNRINRSLPVDWRLWPFELLVDRVWVAELVAVGRLEEEAGERLLEGLDRVERRLETGDPGAEPDEDIHSLVERWLEEEVGDLASAVRLGRSRNDVAATDTRLWTLTACHAMERRIRPLQEALVEAAEGCVDVPFPAYSHLQRAQPTRAAHWLLSHFWPLERGRERLAAAAGRVARLPLGAAAGMGSSLPVDRQRLAERLGLEAPCESSLDAVAGRDWAAEVLYVWTQLAVDLSRLAEDLVLFSSAEFGLVRFADAYSTGSSLMPHKRNPDGAELARARGGTLIGLLTGFLATLKGLPSGYNKDLQEDKRALFAADQMLGEVLDVLAGTIRTLEVVPASAESRLDATLIATDLAEWLAESGVPFREAHDLIGRLVRRAEEGGVAVADVSDAERAEIHPILEGLEPGFWDVEAALERRGTAGGTSRAAVERQLAAARSSLVADGKGP